MPETVVVRGSGGAIFEMDIPTRAHAAELYAEQIAKGELVVVTDPVEWVELPDGARQLRLVASGAVDVPDVAREPRRRGRPPKVQSSQDSPVEGSPADEVEPVEE